MNSRKIEHIRYRTYEILEVRSGIDHAARVYDFIYLITIILNLTVSIMYTYDTYRTEYGDLLIVVENITVALFCFDYILRLWTAKYMYPEYRGSGAVRKYVLSFTGIIDMLSFLPYYLPFFFPSGAVAFRMLRVMRIFRLFRINAYYDSLKLITEVLNSKRQQLFSSVFTILILMLASSLCMYSLEHEAQPEVFTNAFSGIWWSASTLLTGWIRRHLSDHNTGETVRHFHYFSRRRHGSHPYRYHIRRLCRPVFPHQTYGRIRREADVHFIKIHLTARDPWVNRSIAQLHLPERVIVAVVQRTSPCSRPPRQPYSPAGRCHGTCS